MELESLNKQILREVVIFQYILHTIYCNVTGLGLGYCKNSSNVRTYVMCTPHFLRLIILKKVFTYIKYAPKKIKVCQTSIVVF